MDSMKILDNLWAGMIYNIEFDLLLQRISMYIKVIDGEITKYFELSFEGVLLFKVQYPNASSWEQVELTEIYYSKEENYKFEITLWVEDQNISIESKNWKLNLIEEFNGKE